MEKIKYVNHLGEAVELGTAPIFAGENDLRNYKWNYLYNKKRIKNLYKGVAEKNLLITIICLNEEIGIQVKNRIFEVFEKDVLQRVRGKIYIGDYYLTGNIVASQKSKYYRDKGCMEVTVTIATDNPFWIREKTFAFLKTADYETDNKHYRGYRYPWRYANGLNNAEVINDHFAAANFKMIVYGHVVNPQVVIGGYIYQLYTVLEEGEYITIDSIAKTVQKVMVDGRIVNVFNDRDKRNSVFRPIQPGRQQVSWSGQFDWELTVYEERGEPKWD